MGTVSFREHIRWGRDPPSEPTLTLVLTSPGRYFVDIRVLKTRLPSASASPGLGPEYLDWAIGGTSASEPRSNPDGTPFSHSVFTHWVDSRTREPENAADAGDMFPQPDGTTLETGRMLNPATGQDSDYEELWRDGKSEDEPALPKCTVLQLHDDAHHTRGLFVQLGPRAQGVLRVGHVFTAERWQWSGAASMWKREFSVGDKQAQSLDDVMPAFRIGASKGEKLDTRTGIWTILEANA